MNFAIVAIFGFLSGAIACYYFVGWSFHSSLYARRAIIKVIHEKYAAEFYAVCDEVCGAPPRFELISPTELAAVIRSREQKDDHARTQEDSEQSEVSSEEASREGDESGRAG